MKYDKEMASGILCYLEQIEDPREKRGVRYRFADLLLIAIYSILSGHSEATEMEYYAELNFEYFRKLIKIKEVPSHDTFSRVLRLVDIDYLAENITQWIRENFPEVCERTGGYKVLHVDGKAVRGAAEKSKGENPVYNLNAMYEGESIGLYLRRIGTKENEIVCLPSYLELFNLKDTVVTIDAIGCNQSVIKKITEKGGSYMMIVKENQKKLLNCIQNKVTELTASGEFENLNSTEKKVKDHGRIETIKMTMLHDTSFIYEALGTDSFYGTIAKVGIMDKKTIRKEHGREIVSEQRTYVITDLERISVENMLKIKLSHWNVEAQHWLLDVQLNEDRMTARKGNAVTSGAVLRRFCLMMRKYCPEFESKPLKRFLMANEHDITRIEKILFLSSQC